MTTVRQVARDALVWALATKAAWRGIRVIHGLGKLVLGAAATRECHKDAIALLKAWAKWSAVATNTEVPGRLFIDTLRMIKDHDGSIAAFMDKMNAQTNEDTGAQTKRPASDNADADKEEIKTGG